MRLESARAKLARARHHQRELGDLERKYISAVDRPFEVVPDEDGLRYNRGRLPPVPQDLALTLGDAIQNTRSALDHAVFALADHRKPELPAFLISRSEAHWTKAAEVRVGALSETHRAFIRSLQSFWSGDPRLDELSDLSNIDKHRALSVVASLVDARYVGHDHEHSEATAIRWYPPALAEGDPVVWVRDSSYRPGVEVFLSLPAVTSTGPMIRRDVQTVLASLVGYAEWIVRALEGPSPRGMPRNPQVEGSRVDVQGHGPDALGSEGQK